VYWRWIRNTHLNFLAARSQRCGVGSVDDPRSLHSNNTFIFSILPTSSRTHTQPRAAGSSEDPQSDHSYYYHYNGEPSDPINHGSAIKGIMSHSATTPDGTRGKRKCQQHQQSGLEEETIQLPQRRPSRSTDVPSVKAGKGK
jgi:hypothetical protein